MAVGLAIGIVGGALLLPAMRRVAAERGALSVAHAGLRAASIYGVAAVAHGSGFLAVFVAGLLVGDARAPVQGRDRALPQSLASLAEIVVFVALGLTIDLSDLGDGTLWREGSCSR